MSLNTLVNFSVVIHLLSDGVSHKISVPVGNARTTRSDGRISRRNAKGMRGCGDSGCIRIGRGERSRWGVSKSFGRDERRGKGRGIAIRYRGCFCLSNSRCIGYGRAWCEGIGIGEGCRGRRIRQGKRKGIRDRTGISFSKRISERLRNGVGIRQCDGCRKGARGYIGQCLRKGIGRHQCSCIRHGFCGCNSRRVTNRRRQRIRRRIRVGFSQSVRNCIGKSTGGSRGES